MAPDPGRLLEAVGIGALEERVYRTLLGMPGATLAQVSDATGLTRNRLRAPLRSLERNGFLSRSAGKPSRYMPVAPDVAVEVLVLKRREELERARLSATRLTEAFRDGREPADAIELVEIVSGQEAYAQRFKQLQRTAQAEIVVFDKPPYATPLPEQIEVELELLRRGVRYRAIYDRVALEVPGQLAVLERLVAAGEQARTTGALPLKLAIADRRLGLIPLHLDGGGLEATDAVLLHASPLLDALTVLFDLLWARATPIRLADSRAAGEPAALSERDERLLVLLAAGLMDQAIALQLGIGLRTVERRVRSIMDALGAQTRFQAGVAAAERGWLRGGQ
jgi:sugar-specific transcriptional regulator TrmB/DNA-binding CsgD family transcriptional regulator